MVAVARLSGFPEVPVASDETLEMVILLPGSLWMSTPVYLRACPLPINQGAFRSTRFPTTAESALESVVVSARLKVSHLRFPIVSFFLVFRWAKVAPIITRPHWDE